MVDWALESKESWGEWGEEVVDDDSVSLEVMKEESSG